MYVVQIESDQATTFRMFRRVRAARAWAAVQGGEGSTSAIAVHEVAPGIEGAFAAAAVRDGASRLLARLDRGPDLPSVSLPACDIAFAGAVAQ